MQSSHEYISKALEYWEKNEPLQAGRLIFENLPESGRPGWAAKILKSVVERTRTKSPPIERILDIASRPSDWNKAHGAFSFARKATLELDKVKIRSCEQKILHNQLLLAELVAKIIYNATKPRDPFDKDSGWWVAVCLKAVLDLLADEQFSRSMWLVLSHDE